MEYLKLIWEAFKSFFLYKAGKDSEKLKNAQEGLDDAIMRKKISESTPNLNDDERYFFLFGKKRK